MGTTDNDASVFGTRHWPAEELYFRLSRFGRRDLALALTDGGAEMAYATVFLRGGTLTMLDEVWTDPPPERLEGFGGEHLWFFDDGLLSDEELVAIARTLWRSGPASVGIASAVASKRLRSMAGSGVIQHLVTCASRAEVGTQPLYNTAPRPAEHWVSRLRPLGRAPLRLVDGGLSVGRPTVVP